MFFNSLQGTINTHIVTMNPALHYLWHLDDKGTIREAVNRANKKEKLLEDTSVIIHYKL